MKGKFIVIKVNDVIDYLDEEQQKKLGTILDEIYHGRENDGKKPCNNYLIVNRDDGELAKETEGIFKKYGIQEPFEL